MTLAEGTLARTRCSACSIARATSGDDNPGSNSTSFRDQRARREVEWASVRGSTTIPHRRSLTGGAHSSSRLAPMTLPSRPGDEPPSRLAGLRRAVWAYLGGVSEEVADDVVLALNEV